MKMKNFFTFFLLLAGDITGLLLSFYLAYIIRVEVIAAFISSFIKIRSFFPIEHFYSFWILLIIYIFFFFYEKLYFKRHSFWVEFIYILRGLFISSILIILLVFFMRKEENFARTIILLMFLNGIIIIPLFRYIIKFILVKTGLYLKKIAVISKGATEDFVCNTLDDVWYMGYHVVGIISDKARGKMYLGTRREISSIIKKYDIEGIVIIEENFSKEELNQMISQTEYLVPEIKLIPDGLALKTIGIEPEYVNELLILNVSNNLAVPVNQWYKQIFDLFFSFLISLCLVPFFFFIALLIRLDSKGPVFHTQERIGYKGKLFKFLKFRSMYVDGDKRLNEFFKHNKQALSEWKKYKKLKSFDPRVTRIGRFIRRFSIDEMPQIFNVLLGQMSIIGPRPYLPREEKQIGNYCSVIFNVKPGLTGLWQIRGRNKLSFETRLKLDEFYVRNWSFFLDFMILAKTLKVVLTGEGAY